MIKLLKNLRKKEIFLILISCVFIFISVDLELKMPDYMATITKLVQTEGSKMKDIITNGGYMLLCALGSLICSIVVGFLISYIASKFSMNIRSKLFNTVEDLDMEEIKEFSPSSLITRTTNDVSQIEMLLGMGLQLLIKAPITAVWAVTKILNKNMSWSIITAVSLAILLVTLIIISLIVVPKFKIVQKLIDKLNNVTRENLTGIRVVRAFNAENYQENKFNEVNTSLTKQQMFNQKTFAIMSPMMYLVMYFLTLSIYYVGAYLINDASFSSKIGLFGDMIVFSSYAMQVIMSFLMLAMIFMMLPRAQVSAKRINEVLDKKVKLKEGNITSSKETGTITFKNVSFKYPKAEEYVLKDISFDIKKGETVAFIGSTGSGKSTLINLIPRFYDVTEGEILVDNINVKEYKEEVLNDKIGYIPQKAVIFSGTINSNIGFGKVNGKKVSLKKIKESANVAQASEFIEKLDKKYDSLVARSGTNLSGGQKQRIAIARAIARNPEIYIFDDSFSALDYKTDYTLRKELKKYTKSATILIVAQRIGTIINADKIIVLDNGNCVGIGTHKELLKTCDVYKTNAQTGARSKRAHPGKAKVPPGHSALPGHVPVLLSHRSRYLLKS